MTVCPGCELYYSRIAKDWDVPIPKECFDCGIQYRYQHFLPVDGTGKRCVMCKHGGSKRCSKEDRNRFNDCLPPNWTRWERQ